MLPLLSVLYTETPGNAPVAEMSEFEHTNNVILNSVIPFEAYWLCLRLPYKALFSKCTCLAEKIPAPFPWNHTDQLYQYVQELRGSTVALDFSTLKSIQICDTRRKDFISSRKRSFEVQTSKMVQWGVPATRPLMAAACSSHSERATFMDHNVKQAHLFSSDKC